MTDQWVPGPPPPPAPPPNGLPPSNSWIAAVPCAASGDNPSIVDGVVITGVPAQVLAPGAWGITLNDGGTPPNFSIDHYDASGAFIESPIEISGASGDVTLNHDPTQELGAATKHYVDNTGLREAPIDNTTYGRDNGAWVPLPQTYMPEAPNTTQLYGRFNSTWSLVPIQTDAPVDGQAYLRQSGAWALGVTGGPYLPLTGGTLTGPLYLQGSNMLALNSPLASGQSAILGQKSGLNRWQLMLGDYTTEGLNNVGSNFSLVAFSTTGPALGTWLSIARADGSATFNGSGVTIQGGLSVNGTFAVAGPGNLAIYGGNPGDALTTNGAGILAWGARVAEAPTDGQFYSRRSGAWAVSPGGMTDAPNDGTAYARKSQAWAHLTHADITDWAANVPPASTTPPLMDGAAAPGSAGAFARGDHVHPTDTSRAAVTALPPASTVAPLPNGNAAVGVSAAYARADHVHPVDAYPHDNRIINGDMRIDQRNNGVGGTAAGYTCDRWRYGATQTAKFNWQRLNPGAGVTGFPFNFAFTSTSAYASLATDAFYFFQIIEADMISDFLWGTANAQPVTLSFWVWSSLSGTFGGSIENTAGTRSYPFTFSIPAASTWTKIVIAIPGDTGGTWVLSGNAGAVNLNFDLGSGANYRGPANAWAGANYTGANGAVSVVGTNAATFNITGVKLETGSVATPFNRQSLAKSFADCQRYYQSGALFGQFYQVASSGVWVGSLLPVMMRAAPTTAILSQSSTNITGFTINGSPGNLWTGGLATASGSATVNMTWSASAEL